MIQSQRSKSFNNFIIILMGECELETNSHKLYYQCGESRNNKQSQCPKTESNLLNLYSSEHFSCYLYSLFFHRGLLSVLFQGVKHFSRKQSIQAISLAKQIQLLVSVTVTRTNDQSFQKSKSTIHCDYVQILFANTGKFYVQQFVRL